MQDRKRVNTLLNTENQRLKSTVRDLEGRLVLSESSSGARDAVGECAALRAFKNTVSSSQWFPVVHRYQDGQTVPCIEGHACM